jgi:hypothetical protein
VQSLPSHPHIIKYKHSYLYENDLYLILELAESGDISLLLEQQRKKGSYFQEAEIWSGHGQGTHGCMRMGRWSDVPEADSDRLRGWTRVSAAQALLRSDR